MSAAVRPATAGEIELSAFAGPVLGASAWPAINVEGRRVGMIVAAEAGIGLVPEVVRRADVVKVFHRHPVHVVPDPLAPRTGSVHRLLPLARLVARATLRVSVGNKEMRRQLSPAGEAPVLRSSGWYRALGKQNCQLISWPIARITAEGVCTADGVEHLVDMLIVD